MSTPEKDAGLQTDDQFDEKEEKSPSFMKKLSVHLGAESDEDHGPLRQPSSRFDDTHVFKHMFEEYRPIQVGDIILEAV